MHKTVAELLIRAPILLDGAWGTELQKRGLAIGDCPDALSLTHPLRVSDVARSYVAAGCGIILTNTFGANSIALTRYGLADRAAEINRIGVRISRNAAAGRALVFASIGPTGRMLMMGDITAEEMTAAFHAQAAALAEGGADGLAIETMTDLDEALLAVRAAVTTGLPVVASMVFDSGPDGTHTMMGVSAEAAARALAEAGADVVGANCGAGIESFPSVCRALRDAVPLPLWIKANAGLPALEHGRAIYKTTPSEYASFVPGLLAAGASFVGGCCGTTPEHIRAMRRLLDTRGT